MIAALMVLVPLAGCLGPDSNNGSATPLNPNLEPNDAYGLYAAVVDGYYGSSMGILSEWYDSLEEEVDFDIIDSDGTAPGNGQNIGSKESLFNIKKVMLGPNDDLQFAVRFDYPNIDQDVNPVKRVVVDVGSRVYSNNIDMVVGAQSPTFVGSNLDQLEAVYDPSNEQLTIEGSSDDLFLTSNQIQLQITVILEDMSVWKYSRSSYFKYVLPLYVPHNDLSVTGIEVTQAIQTENNDIRLVSGKDTLARVYVDSTMSPTAQSVVTLELCDYIWGCYDHLRKVHIAVDDPQREAFTDSANFVLPPHWTQEIQYSSPTGMILRGVTLKATVEPYYPSGNMDFAEIDWSNNEYSQVVDFTHTTDLTVWSVRVGEQVDGWYTDVLQPPNLEYLPQNEAYERMEITEMLLPVSSLEVIDFGGAMAPDCIYQHGADECMAGIEAWWLQFYNSPSSPFPNADQIHGMTPTYDQVSPGLIGNPGFDDYGGLSCPAWACGWFGTTTSTASWTPTIGSLHSVQGVCDVHTVTCAAHEMTHNFGPYCYDPVDPWSTDCNDANDEAWGAHVKYSPSADPCGTSGMDKVWYYNLGPEMTIKDLGWNSLASNPETNQDALVPDNYPDYMSNCQASMNQAVAGVPSVPYMTEGGFLQWVSTHRWEWMFDKFDNWQEGNPAYPYNGRSIDNERSARIIVGSMNTDGSNVSIEKSWTFDGSLAEEHRNYGDEISEDSRFKILATDESGEIIQSIYFNPPSILNHMHDHGEEDHGHDHGDGEHNHDTDGETDDEGGETSSDSVRNVTNYSHSSSFIFAIQDDDSMISKIQLFDDNKLVQTIESRESSLSISLDENFISEILDSKETITWEINTEFEGTTFSQVEYSWDGIFWMPLGGMTEYNQKSIDFSSLPGGEKSQLRIRVTNGFDTEVVYSDTFTVKDHSAEFEIEYHGKEEFNMYSGSVSIYTRITDFDFDDVDESRISQSLQRDGKLVWDNEPTDNGRQSTLKSPGMKSINSGEIYTTFPNAELLPGELTPGNYVYTISYLDESEDKVEESVRFTILEPIYSNLDVNGIRDNLRSVSKESLKKVESLIQNQVEGNDLTLSGNEMTWLVEYDRMIEQTENSLSEKELKILSEKWDLDFTLDGTSSDKPLISVILMPKDE